MRKARGEEPGKVKELTEGRRDMGVAEDSLCTFLSPLPATRL